MQSSQPENIKHAAADSRQKKIIQAGTALTLLAFSTWLCFVGVRVFRQIATSKWPVVEGWVLDSSYREYSSGRSGERGAAELTVRYEYALDGKTYQSDEFMAGVKRYKREAELVSSLTNQYHVGAPVKVRYDPKHPERAVLRSDPDLLDKVTIVFLTIAIGFIAFNFKPKVK
jgi:hypothetical protein